jgi:hypothetical protein
MLDLKTKKEIGGKFTQNFIEKDWGNGVGFRWLSNLPGSGIWLAYWLHSTAAFCYRSVLSSCEYVSIILRLVTVEFLWPGLLIHEEA